MTGQALKGRDFDLKIDASIVASATDFSITPNRDMIEIATLGSSNGKEFIPDMYGYTVSVNGLVFRGEGDTQRNYFDMLDKMLNTDVSVAWIALPDVSSYSLSGWGYLSSAPMQVGVGSAVTYSVEIQGCGVITKTAV